jgi:ATP synthase protein I
MVNVDAQGRGRKGFEDESEDPPVRALSFEEAQALRARHPAVSPWRVVRTQAAIGGVAAVLAGLVTGVAAVFWSALYGAATAVVPGALMARGMTSRFTSVSPGVSGVSVMFWSLVKIGFSVLMLLIAPRLIQPLSWPALLANLVLCVQVYWLALLWRGR